MLTVEKVIILKSVDIFSMTPEEYLVTIALHVEEIEFAPGDVILRKGELGTSMYVMIDGKVRVHDGDREIATLTGRRVFGELAAINPEPRSADVTALEETLAFQIKGSLIYELMSDNIDLARGIIAELCKRLRAAE